jgi:hypothetical protein
MAIIFLEIEFDGFFDPEWITSYRQGILEMGQYTIFGSGCPSIVDVSFEEKRVLTKSFSEMAKSDLKQFLDEFSKAVESMNRVHERLVAKEKAEEEKEKQAKEDREAKLKDMNDWIK